MQIKFLAKLSSNESGATLVEYGIAVVLALTVGTAGLIGLATQINSNMTTAANEMAKTDSQ